MVETKICRKCGHDLPISSFNTSVSKYVVGGCVKAVYETVRHVCRNCQHPKGWHLKYYKKDFNYVF